MTSDAAAKEPRECGRERAARNTHEETLMFVINRRKGLGIQVNSRLHRQIARHIFRVTAAQHGVKEARRQASKYVQFGLYDSEKTYTDLRAAALAAAA